MNKRHEKNLLKLADYLDSLPRGYKHFDMGDYCKYDVGPYFDTTNPDKVTTKLINKCGTVACALGHGPVAGIRVKPGEYWFNYSERQFGIIEHSFRWDWCFHYEWANVPRQHTPKAAAKRIRRLVKNGLTKQMVSYMQERLQ